MVSDIGLGMVLVLNISIKEQWYQCLALLRGCKEKSMMTKW